MLSIFARIDNWRRDWTENSAALEPDHSDPSLRPLLLDANSAAITEFLAAWAGDQKQWDLQSQSEIDGTIQIHLTRTTKMLGFVDDVQIELKHADQKTAFHAESQSRVGKGDLGQNPRNLKELVTAVSAKFATDKPTDD